jgi:hypothetical protein
MFSSTETGMSILMRPTTLRRWVGKSGPDRQDFGVELSISWLTLRLIATNLGHDEVAMKYVMLIYQGTALERQATLSEEEQKRVYADYQGIKQTPGLTPRAATGSAGERDHCAGRGWQDPDRRTGRSSE